MYDLQDVQVVLVQMLIACLPALAIGIAVGGVQRVLGLRG
jgi:hypothetical protein